jgi:hypothetical protein
LGGEAVRPYCSFSADGEQIFELERDHATFT